MICDVLSLLCLCKNVSSNQWKVEVLVAQSCPTLCDPVDCSPPGSSVHGILQARILEWVTTLSSRGSSQPRDWTQVSGITGRFFSIWATSVACCCCCEVTSVVSNSVRPHRQQPTRLSHPWDSPGRNTGVGCHFLLQCMQVKSEREVTQSCPTLCNPMDCSLPGSSAHGIFQAKVLEWGAIAFSDTLHKVLLISAFLATNYLTPHYQSVSLPSTCYNQHLCFWNWYLVLFLVGENRWVAYHLSP